MMKNAQIMKKRIAIVEHINKKDHIAYLRYLGRNCKLDIIVMDLSSIHALNDSGINFRTIDDFISNEDRMNSLERCVRFVREWHNGIPDPLVYKGINLAMVVQLPVLTLLLRIDELFYVLRNILSADKDDIELYIISSDETKKRIDIIVSGLSSVRSIKIFYRRSFLKIAIRPFAKEILSYIVSSLWGMKRTSAKLSAAKPAVLFYECLDRIGSIPGYIAGSLNSVALYPLFSIKMLDKSKKTGSLYSVVRQPAFISRIKSDLLKKGGWRKYLAASLKDLFKTEDALTVKISAYIVDQIAARLPSYTAFIDGIDGSIGDFSLVITSNDTTPLAKLVTLIAQKHKISTLVLQHGVTSGGEVAKINGSKYFGIGFLPLISDKMAVAGQISMSWFAENGISSDRIVITGMPQLDRYLNCRYDRKEMKKKACGNFGMDVDSKLILFATQHSNDRNRLIGYHLTPLETYMLLNEVGKIVAGFENMNLIIKMHPNSEDKEALYADIMNRCGVRKFAVTKDYDTGILLMASDLVITPWSTTGLEAILLGKELITVNLTGTPDKMPYAEKGAAVGVYSREGLKKSLSEFQKYGRIGIDDQNIETFKKGYNDPGDKTASENCARLILDMVEDNT